MNFQLPNMVSWCYWKGNNKEFVRSVEELVAIWSRQVEQVITETEQIRREADDVGPSAELNYWINRRNYFEL